MGTRSGADRGSALMNCRAPGKRSFVRNRSRESTTTTRQPVWAASWTTGTASCPAPQTTRRIGGRNTSTNAWTSPPRPGRGRTRDAPSCSAAIPARAAQPQPPHHVITCRQIICHQTCLPAGHDLVCNNHHVALQAPPADVAHHLLAAGQQQPRALAAVCGAAHADDRRQRHRLPLAAETVNRIQNLDQLFHPWLLHPAVVSFIRR